MSESDFPGLMSLCSRVTGSLGELEPKEAGI